MNKIVMDYYVWDVFLKTFQKLFGDQEIRPGDRLCCLGLDYLDALLFVQELENNLSVRIYDSEKELLKNNLDSYSFSDLVPLFKREFSRADEFKKLVSKSGFKNLKLSSDSFRMLLHFVNDVQAYFGVNIIYSIKKEMRGKYSVRSSYREDLKKRVIISLPMKNITIKDVWYIVENEIAKREQFFDIIALGDYDPKHFDSVEFSMDECNKIIRKSMRKFHFKLPLLSQCVQSMTPNKLWDYVEKHLDGCCVL